MFRQNCLHERSVHRVVAVRLQIARCVLQSVRNV
jgi:hypothetical protein